MRMNEHDVRSYPDSFRLAVLQSLLETDDETLTCERHGISYEVLDQLIMGGMSLHEENVSLVINALQKRVLQAKLFAVGSLAADQLKSHVEHSSSFNHALLSEVLAAAISAL